MSADELMDESGLLAWTPCTQTVVFSSFPFLFSVCRSRHCLLDLYFRLRVDFDGVQGAWQDRRMDGSGKVRREMEGKSGWGVSGGQWEGTWAEGKAGVEFLW